MQRTRRARPTSLNSLFVLLGIESWKPLLTALLLPPAPLLLLVLLGMPLVRRRPAVGGFAVLLGLGLLWLGTCLGSAQALSFLMLQPPPALGASRLGELRVEARAEQRSAIVVLGGGVEPYAPEYGGSNLRPTSLERLRYGLWLGRETGIAVAFSGGLGHAQGQSAPEADVAATAAARDFGRPLRWIENGSRDTRENAARSVALLRRDGIEHLIIVTHGWHMPRALRAFTQAVAQTGATMRIEAAPMGLARNFESPALQWLPSSTGFTEVRNVLREFVGLAAGS